MTKIESTPSSSLLRTHPYTEKIFFKIGSELKSILSHQISVFYAEDKTTYAVVKNRRFPTNVTLKVIEGMLSPRFIRCHRKYVVNIDFIDGIDLKEQNVNLNGRTIPIGHAYRKTFMEGLTILK